jgi:hypothetical protein
VVSCPRSTCAGKFVPFAPAKWPDLVWHTNHSVANADYTPQYRKALERDRGRDEVLDNGARRRYSLERRLAVDSVKIDAERIPALRRRIPRRTWCASCTICLTTISRSRRPSWFYPNGRCCTSRPVRRTRTPSKRGPSEADGLPIQKERGVPWT